MRYAVDRYKIGSESEVDAEKFSGCLYIPNRRKRFYCPECGEIVFFRDKGGAHPSHFFHQEKTDKTPECDKRVDGRSELSLRERVGLPIYLIRMYGEEFQLNLGFPSLGKDLLAKAVEAHYTVEISSRSMSQRVMVDSSNFIEDETTLIPLNFIPENAKNYRITINGLKPVYAINRKWSDYADGFEYGSAIFSFDEIGGKKIKRGDSISTHKSYYVCTPYRIKDYPEIICTDEGRLVINNTIYNIFKIEIIVSADNIDRFRMISNYIKRIFGVWLLERAPELIPLWPPVVEQEMFVPVNNRSNLVCAVSSGNELPNVYVYSERGTAKLNIQAQNGKHYVDLCLNSKPLLLSVDRKYVGREVSFAIRDVGKSDYDYDIQFKTNNCVCYSLEDVVGCELDAGFSFLSNGKMDLFAGIKNKTYRKKTIREKETDVLPIEGIEELYIIIEGGVYKHIRFEKKSSSSDEIRKSVIALLCNSKGNRVPIPIWAWSNLCEISKMENGNYKHIVGKITLGGKIPIDALKALKGVNIKG